jgi:hypothetical protein
MIYPAEWKSILIRIPVAAGLAGGSTDAAAAIVAANKLWDLGMTVEDMMAAGVHCSGSKTLTWSPGLFASGMLSCHIQMLPAGL